MLTPKQWLGAMLVLISYAALMWAVFLRDMDWRVGPVVFLMIVVPLAVYPLVVHVHHYLWRRNNLPRPLPPTAHRDDLLS